MPVIRPEECDWLPDDNPCENPAVGDAAHPIRGVVKVCQAHVDAFGIPLISPRTKD